MSYLQSRKCEERDNVTRCWQWRQIDGNPPKYENAKRTLENAAEDHLVNKETLEERSCEVPGVPKSTFLMVFSPDGTRVASTHGNHNIYLSDLSTGKHLKTLTGHPRTPWCITFHPSKPRLLASGCLGGQVRVWDLDGGSEVWAIENEIASIAFHPQDQMLVVASFNELYFWDWKHSKPYIKVRTNSIKEKVRFVAFDSLGHKLITGISINNSHPASLLNSNNFAGIPYLSHNNNNNNNQGDNNDQSHPHLPPPPPPLLPSEATRQRLAQSYEILMNQYRQLLAEAPIPAHTIDRGTDPMEVDNTHFLPQFRGIIPRPPQPVVVRRIPFYVQYSGNVNRSNIDPPNDEYLPMHSFPRPPTLESEPNNLQSANNVQSANSVQNVINFPNENDLQHENNLQNANNLQNENNFQIDPNANNLPNTNNFQNNSNANNLQNANNFQNDSNPNNLQNTNNFQNNSNPNNPQNTNTFQNFSNSNNLQNVNSFQNGSNPNNLQNTNNFQNDSNPSNLQNANHFQNSSNANNSQSNRNDSIINRVQSYLRERIENANNFQDLFSSNNLHNVNNFQNGSNPNSLQNENNFPNDSNPNNLRNANHFRIFSNPNNLQNVNNFQNGSNLSNLQNTNNFPNDSNPNNLQNVNNFQNASHLSNLQNTNNFPNNSNPSNLQNVNNFQNGSNPNNLQNDSIANNLQNANNFQNNLNADNSQNNRIDSMINQVQSYLRERMEFRRLNQENGNAPNSDINGQAEPNAENRTEPNQNQRLENNDPLTQGEASNSSFGHVFFHIENDRLFSSRQSAFLPLIGMRQEEERNENPSERSNIPNNPRTRSHLSTLAALPIFRDAALRTARTEFSASLHRIHGFMETSIDETLNYWDRYANGPRPSHIEVLREFPTRRYNPNNPTPPASASNTSSIPNSQLNIDSRYSWSNIDPTNSRSNIDPTNSRSNIDPTTTRSNTGPTTSRFNVIPTNPNFNRDPTNSSARTHTRFNLNTNSIDSQLEREQRPDRLHYGIFSRNVINSRNNLFNVFTDSHDPIPMSIMQFNSNSNLGNQPSSNPATGEPRAAFFSSDDDSDGDREMFSPLPGRIYVNRNVLDSSSPARSFPHLLLRAFMPPSSAAPAVDPNLQQNNPNLNRSNNPESLITSNNQNEDHQYYVRNFNADNNNSFHSNDIRNPYLNMNRNEPNSSHGVNNNPGPSQEFDPLQPDDIPLGSENRETRSSIAFQKVTTSVKLLEKHTEKLLHLWASRPAEAPVDVLVKAWEDLRRDMIALDNTTGRIDPEQFLRERMNQPSTSASSPSPSTSTSVADGSNDQTSSETGIPELNSDPSSSAQGDDSTPEDENMPSTSTGIRHSQNPRSGQPKTYPPSKRSNPRRSGSTDDQNPTTRKKMRSFIMNAMNRNTLQKWQNILHLRSSVKRKLNRNPTETTQQGDIASIRIKARTILRFMFNMMIHCLEAEQLGNLIVNMLRLLKKSLSITCVLLLPSINSSNTRTDSDNLSENNSEYESDDDSSRLNSAELAGNSLVGVTSEWSDRIAVQISAVNRNHSNTANNRRESYNKMCSSWRSSLINSNSQNPQRWRKRRSSKKISNTSKRLRLGLNMPSTSSSNLPPRPSSSYIPPTAVPSTSHIPPRQQFRPNRTFPQVRQVPNPTLHRQAPNPFPQRQSSNPIPQRLILNPAHIEQMRDLSSNVRRLLFIRNRDYRMNLRRNLLNIHRDRWIPRSSNSVIVPTVRVNDVPVSEMHQHGVPEGGARFAAPRVAEFIQPVFVPNLVVSDENIGIGIIDPGIHAVESHPMSRIQVWNFAEGEVPDIRNTTKNIVVSQCKILNDASVDISKDGQLLVALIPPPNTRNCGSLSHRLGIYSLDWNCLGDCLYYTLLEQNAVSVSLSPCARHLAVGLSTKRLNLQSYGRNGIMALIFRLGKSKHKDAEGNGGLIPVRTLEQSSEIGLTSLNCLRWAPQPGQGLLYANNVGQLKILS